jgi:acyl-[acyl carrier protein]--UDP-N-acetylglucosamine O-acyltransferase
VNLKRKNFSDGEILQIKKIFKIFYMSGLNRSQATAAMLRERIGGSFQREFLDFIEGSNRGFA